jgi:hypothetical protein
MNNTKSFTVARLALAASLAVSALLGACGGGADNEAAQAAAPETAQALTTPAGTDFDAASEGSADTAPQASWELEDDAVESAAFLTRHMHASVPTEQAQAAADADTRVKWNPGHYIALPLRDPDAILKALAEVRTLPQVKGLILRYEWSQLETAQGVYDFTRVERDLGLAQAAGKRLWVMVGTKVFRPGGRAVPDYLMTPEYEGGAYKILIGARDAIGSTERYGQNAALHNAKVRDRLIALTTAMGARLNRHNALEGITFNETAMGQMLVPLSTEQKRAYFDHLAQVDAATQRAFPNTVVMQFINFPKTYMPGLITSMANNRVALGGPDIFLQDRDLNTNIYPLYDIAKGKVAVGPSVQPENYVTTVQHGAHNPPKISELYAFGRTRLSANYMFWTRPRFGNDYPRVLEFFKSSAFPKDAAGGLITTCPSTYPACVTKL